MKVCILNPAPTRLTLAPAYRVATNFAAAIDFLAIGTTSRDSMSLALLTPRYRTQNLEGAVARHKAVFFEAKGADGAIIDYASAVSGQLHLIPSGEALRSLETDYQQMIEDRLLPEDEADTFRRLLERCLEVQDRANRSR